MPEDKTNLTKASVEGSDETASSRKQAGNPDLYDADGVPWKNRAEENRKKYEAVTEKLEGTEARLAELDEKVRLTESEKAEKKRLESKADNLEAELHDLEVNPAYRAYRNDREKTKKSAVEEAKEETKKEFYAEAVQDYLEDAIDDAEEDSVLKGMTVKDLRGELNKLLKMSHMELTPTRRIKVLLKEFKNSRVAAKSEAERKAKEQEGNQHSEGDGRAGREMTMDEAKKKGDVASILKLAGKY